LGDVVFFAQSVQLTDLLVRELVSLSQKFAKNTLSLMLCLDQKFITDFLYPDFSKCFCAAISELVINRV
jgi:hypothetical protein